MSLVIGNAIDYEITCMSDVILQNVYSFEYEQNSCLTANFTSIHFCLCLFLSKFFLKKLKVGVSFLPYMCQLQT